jgi:hypothetical protein
MRRFLQRNVLRARVTLELLDDRCNQGVLHAIAATFVDDFLVARVLDCRPR